eukprot:3933177-Prymnesium_polylepis.1
MAGDSPSSNEQRPLAPLVKRQGEVSRADHTAIGSVSMRCGHVCAVHAVRYERTTGWTTWRLRLFGSKR